MPRVGRVRGGTAATYQHDDRAACGPAPRRGIGKFRKPGADGLPGAGPDAVSPACAGCRPRPAQWHARCSSRSGELPRRASMREMTKILLSAATVCAFGQGGIARAQTGQAQGQTPASQPSPSPASPSPDPSGAPTADPTSSQPANPADQPTGVTPTSPAIPDPNQTPPPSPPDSTTTTTPTTTTGAAAGPPEP